MALLAVGFAIGCQRPAATRRHEGRFGSVPVYAPATAADGGMVFLFSGADGWNDGLDADAQALARDGNAVVGVDLPQYLRGLAASDDGCHYLLSEVEDLSKRVQRDLGLAAYRTPLLAGVGAGGTLAYAALAQSPAATVAGAVSVDAAPALATRVPLCPGAPHTAVEGGFAYGPARLPASWIDSHSAALPAEVRALATPAAGQGTPDERLLAALRSALGSQRGDATLADLPLVELPSAQPGEVMAVIYSGDGGWRDIDKQIGEALAAAGVPVIGVDSLRYFWRARTPEQVGADLARILDTYSTRWQRPRVMLVGYSFGAGILPFAYNRLPADQSARVVQLSLLGVEPRAAFEFSVGGWLGDEPPPGSPEVLPELQRIPAAMLQCVMGEDEPHSLCRDPALAGVEIIRTSGGHHFDGDYQALARRLLDGARRHP